MKADDAPELAEAHLAHVTTGPNGERMTLDQRLAEIVSRYGEDHSVTRCMIASRPVLALAIERTQLRLANRDR
jgi:hypothetical protein